MNEPLRFKLPSKLRRFVRPIAYRLLRSVHGIKIDEILREKKRRKIKVFIETGTYLGDTVDSLVDKFEKIYSIELDRKLYLRAKRLFAKDKNVKLLFGDSGELVGRLVSKINEPVLFWLDAHYSGSGTSRGKKDSPISSELKSIMKHPIKGHVILIDDARFFTGKGGYPKLVDLKRNIKTSFPERKMFVRNDIIHIE